MWPEKNNQKTPRGLKRGDFIVGSINKATGAVSIADKPFPHDSHPSAQNEAGRLATKHTDKKFVVLEVKGIAASTSVAWE